MPTVEQQDFHVVVVGWDVTLVESLWSDIAGKSGLRFSSIMHPSSVRSHSAPVKARQQVYFLREELKENMPDPDYELLTSLEREGVPSIHNMILGDRIVSKLPYAEALGYATFLVRRLTVLFDLLKPSVVIGSYDGIHSAVALALSRQLQIPWFTLNFSVIPAGLACFSDRLSAAAQVQVRPPVVAELRSLAGQALTRFEAGSLVAPVYLTPRLSSWATLLKKVPARLKTTMRTLWRSRVRKCLHFTTDRTDLSVVAAVAHLARARQAHKALSKIPVLKSPPPTPYVLFGLHLQPESAIDVWAPFFSNQMWVVELLSRSVPPSHRLLVKIHRSDSAKYSKSQLDAMRSFPGVDIVHPAANARAFIEGASLVFGIQGTMGLEAALLRKPVIMLGESPVTLFPNAAHIGSITDLPALVRGKLAELPPSRDAVLDAYVSYLSPFAPASFNDWTIPRSGAQIDAYVRLFDDLRVFVEARAVS